MSDADTSDVPFPDTPPRHDNPGSLQAIADLIFAPGCEAILTVLSTCDRVDRTFLQNATGLSDPTFSEALDRLEETGFVEVNAKRRPDAPYRLHPEARRTISVHWDDLEALQEADEA